MANSSRSQKTKSNTLSGSQVRDRAAKRNFVAKSSSRATSTKTAQPASVPKTAKPKTVSNRNAKQTTTRQPAWAKYSDEKLLDMRICDLGLSLDDSPIAKMRDQLYTELKSRNLRIKPNCWLSDDWFSPDGVPGIAIPFYLAHPRAETAGAQTDVGSRRWNADLVHANPAS